MKLKTSTFLSLLPLLVILGFYAPYAFLGWFWQDDFLLLDKYSRGLFPAELVDFSNFGRFLSRNVYWFTLSRLPSQSAAVYLLANTAIVAASAALIAWAFRRDRAPYYGLIAGGLYLCLPATIVAYSWISNAQHLLGHFFVLLFLALYRSQTERQGDRLSWPAALGLFLVLFLGLFANVFVGLALSLPFVHLLAEPVARRQPARWALLLAGGLIFLWFILRLRQIPQEAYATRLDFETFATSLAFYFRKPYLGWLWLAAMPCGFAYYLVQRWWLRAWLFLASLLFFAPFALMVHQRYVQYGVLPHLFWALGLWAVANDLVERTKWRRPDLILSGTAALLLLAMAARTGQFFLRGPSGAGPRQQVAQLREALGTPTSGQTICFWPRHPVANTTGVKVWDLPREWWFVGFGKAFEQFVDPRHSYRLAQPGPGCDRSFYLDETALIPASPATEM